MSFWRKISISSPLFYIRHHRIFSMKLKLTEAAENRRAQLEDGRLRLKRQNMPAEWKWAPRLMWAMKAFGSPMLEV